MCPLIYEMAGATGACVDDTSFSASVGGVVHNCNSVALDPTALCASVLKVGGSKYRVAEKCPVTCGQCKECSSSSMCVTECNNYDCGHPNCKPAQILTKCGAETAAAEAINDVPASDASATPLGLKLSFVEPIELALNAATNTVHATATLVLDLQWQDSRLLTTPCRQIWADTISTSDGASEKDQQNAATLANYFWTPALTFSHQIKQSDTRSTYSLSTTSTPWLQTDAPGSAGGTECVGSCAMLSYTTTIEAAQPFREYINYQRYPFDEHVVTFRFKVEDGVFNCSGGTSLANISSEELKRLVEPQSGEWGLSGDNPIELRHARDKDGVTEISSQCEVRVFLYRQSMVQVVKSLVLSLVTVTACLLSSYMHPADHTGDRASIVLVAGLILTANIQADLGLGPINYLIWQDGFNLILIVITLAALAQTVYVHRLWFYAESQSRALSVDRICTAITLYLLFPLVVTGYVLIAFPWAFNAGIALLVATPIVSVILMITLVNGSERRRVANEKAAVEAIRREGTRRQREGSKAPIDNPRYMQQLRRVFKAFDRDGTGYLTYDELRRLLTAVHPHTGTEQLSRALKQIREQYFEQGQLSADQWIEAQPEVERLMEQVKGAEQGKEADQLGTMGQLLNLGSYLQQRRRSKASAPRRGSATTLQHATVESDGLGVGRCAHEGALVA